MKILVSGGGPSGLYFALLAKTRFPSFDIQVHEQNPRDATYGFGIVLAERGLERFRAAHAASYEAIMAASFVTRNRWMMLPGRKIYVEGGGFGGAIARLRLLNILEDFCLRAGVTVHYQSRIFETSSLQGADMVVGADGANSMVRKKFEQAFGTTSWSLTNRMAWYGTRKHFPYPILSFKKHALGHFVAAAYPYTENMSTFVAECDGKTWDSKLATLSEDDRRQLAEEVFAEELDGHSLISNKSDWKALPVIRSRNWHVGNAVIIGDALHSAHPSIGSGTRIAMDDSIDLFKALEQSPADVAKALSLFRTLREPRKQAWVSAAERSFMWYETFGEKVDALSPEEFVLDFMTRTGRVDQERLKAEYPELLSQIGKRQPQRALAAG